MMATTSFRRAKAPSPRRQRDPDEYANYTPRARPVAAAVMAVALHERAPERIDAKINGAKNPAIRESARNERCLLLFVGCRSAAIWSHNRHGRAGKGRSIKAIDLNGCYACPSCDAIYDGNAPMPKGMTRDEIELRWYAAHDQSLVILARKGLI